MPAITIDALSAALRRRLEAQRRPVLLLATRYGVVRESLKERAEPVMALFHAIKAEHAEFTFVEFARLFDPTVPTHAKDADGGVVGYRNHKVYYTLDYMRRLQTQRPRGQQGVRDSATDALARSIATILQVVPDAAPVWDAVQREFAFPERVMTRLKRRVEATRPLFALTVPRAGVVRVGQVIHMERAQRPEAVAEAPAAARPRRRAA